MKIALLSRWHVHADDYVRDIKEIDGLSINIVWDEDPNRGSEWAKELKVPFEADLDKVLSNPDIDAVVINTPTSLHRDIIIKAAENKKHIFTEKVLALTTQDVDEIYKAVETNDVKLMVSLPRLTDNNYVQAEQAIKNEWLGKITTIRCRFAHNGAVAPAGEDNGWLPQRFFNKEEAGGGAMVDLGAHPIYLANRFAGEAQGVYSRLQQELVNTVDDNSALLVDYKSGTIGIVETSFVSYGSPFQLELYGTHGAVFITEDKVQMTSSKVNDGELTELKEDVKEPDSPMVQWIKSIKEGIKPTITQEDVYRLTLINELAFESQKSGRRIEVK